MKNLKPKSLIALFLLPLAGCCDLSSEPVLEIDREAEEFEVIDHGDGTITKQFPLGAHLYEILASDATERTREPFDIKEKPVITAGTWPARRLFEDLNVEFPKGTDADYDVETRILTFRHEPEWVDFAEAVLDAVKSTIQTVNVRVEIYEVPTALALRLEESAREETDHGPELEALRKLIEDGEAGCAFVSSCNVRSQSGERAMYKDGFEHRAFAEFESGESEGAPRPRPRFDTRTVGTIFEVDVVLSPDDVTVDLNLLIEHHTAPPTMTPIAVPIPGEREPVTIEVPEYHAKSVTTILTMRSGDTRLLCSWRPTGLPEFESRDVMRIVFLTTNVQELRYDFGQ